MLWVAAMNRRTFILAGGGPLLLAFAPGPAIGRTTGPARPLRPEDRRFDRMIDKFCRECAARNPGADVAAWRPTVRFISHVRAGLGRNGKAGRGRSHAYLGRLRSLDRALLSGDRRADFERAERALLGNIGAART